MSAETNAQQQKTEVLWMQKGPQTFLFRYQAGTDMIVVNALADLAKREWCGFNWFDAAVLTYQLGRQSMRQGGHT